MIESVEQITFWMKDYDEARVPKAGWSILESEYGKSLNPDYWLIGKKLPAIYAKHIGEVTGWGELVDPVTSERKPQGWVVFILDILDAAGIMSRDGKPYTAGAVDKYRRRAAVEEPFELTGSDLSDNPDKPI